MDGQELANRITGLLSLTAPPIALSFVAEPPADISSYSKEVPSACSFWRDAEKTTFYASAEKHHNCPVGSMVMGFSLSGAVQESLGETVTTMCQQQYISADEPASI